MKTFAPTTTRLVLLTLYLLLRGVVSDNKNKCNGNLDTPGWTIPDGNIVIELGSPLKIYCVLDLNHSSAKGYTAKDLVFMNSNQQIDQKYVTAINETTARLYIENATLFDGIFYCKLPIDTKVLYAVLDFLNMEVKSDKQWTLVCFNEVSVGKKPQDLTHFFCTFYGCETLNCTWHQPFNGVETKYKVVYQTNIADRGPQLYPCPVYEKEKCSWTSDICYSLYLGTHYINFVVEGSNRFGNIMQTFSIDPLANIKVSAPQRLTAVDKTSSSIYLQWSIGESRFIQKHLIYQVSYTSVSSTIWNTSFYKANEVEQKLDYVSVNVSGLNANMMYNFKISMKTRIAINDSFWSPSASLVVKTKSCPPYQSPKTDIGSFQISPIGSTSREISVFWKPIPDEEHNGDDFRYKITVFERGKKVNVKPTNITNSFAKFTDLSLNSYRFRIRATNADGYAPYSTFVNVPSKSDHIPKQVWFGKFDFGRGIYQLSWKLFHRRNYMITSYTVFSCKNNEKWPYECVDLEWIHLDPLHTEIYMRHNYSSPTFNPKFDNAISVNTANSSSGMIWAPSAVIRSIPGEIPAHF